MHSQNPVLNFRNPLSGAPPGDINCVLVPRYIKSSETWAYWGVSRILVQTRDIRCIPVPDFSNNREWPDHLTGAIRPCHVYIRILRHQLSILVWTEHSFTSDLFLLWR